MERHLNKDGTSFCYVLTRKRVKNLNLRVQKDGSLTVSAPARVPVSEVDAFVLSRADWIIAARARLAAAPAELPPCTYTDDECEKFFAPLVEKYAPLFENALSGRTLTLKYRTMKSRWGVCYPARPQITFNRRLLDKPLDAVEYVVVHELVHLNHPNHGKGFYAQLAEILPDYKRRRAALRKM
ncbi:M48 family metallopeptidase [Pygmaiobacter massiliensis]|uniref:M48 family metallopeptidase n=1 Tax=Pygmaiobacter massiliensis TaxID=1917873 RepID=UPI002A7EA753|nr:M48 family metallopeptidase [Pygmaiobacter massiliensis]MDY4783727.1 M48 family metallopeptidase [Pygmaiobacter massiliensis]